MGTAFQSLDLARQLEQAFNSVGTSMMSDDFASKLLAWLYVEGGGNELVTHHHGLIAGIGIAQQKFNIKGGEIPNRRGAVLIKVRIAQLMRGDRSWLSEIEKRYNIKINNHG